VPVFALPGEIPPAPGRSIAGRVIVTPWGRGGRARPRLGVAVTSSTVAEGLNSLRGRSVFEAGFFDRIYVRGRRTRLGGEAEWSPGPFGLRAEYIRVTEGRERQGLGDSNLSDLIARSWYMSGTWVITGEKKAGGVKPPRRPLFQGGAGAFEVGTRMESVRFSSASREGPAFTNPRAEHVAPSGERVWTTGVTWFWNRWFRIQVNAIREEFDDPARSPAPGTRRFWSGVLRTQLAI
jgi:phosphate-selective porin